MIYSHIADAIKSPSLINLKDNLYVARFESMKIYSTLAAIKHLLDCGKVRKGDTLLDSSSGIYAYALGLACQKYGLHCHIIASKTVDATLKLQLELMGATVEPVKASPTLKMDQEKRVERIAEILADRNDVHWMQQYHDDIHYRGYQEFADLIASAFDGSPITLVGGVGSGCSTGAATQFLRQKGIDTIVHGVQPFGSVTFGAEHVDDPDIIIAGIGSAIPFRNVRHTLYDHIHWISFAHSLSGTVALLKRHGIFAGLSSGSCHTVANWCRRHDPDRPCLFIAADTGHRYLDPVFRRHQEAADIDGLTPKRIDSMDALTLPWCVMDWEQRAWTKKQTETPAMPVA